MKVTSAQYAHSVLGLKLAAKELDAFQETLTAFTKILSREQKLRAFLLNPEVSAAQKELWLTKATSENFARFLLLIITNHDTKKLPAIGKRLESLRDAAEGVVRVVATTPTPLSASQKQKLQATYEDVLKKKIRMVVQQDPTLIGGMTLKVGDEITDSSIKTRLEIFRKSFTRN